MSESAVLNGKQSGASELTPEQYKELCRKVKQYQVANSTKKRKPKPIINTLGELEALAIKAKAQKSQTEWDMLKNGMPFITDITATLIYVKTGKERAMCLNTMQSIPIAGGMVHRVFF
jgi:hypothetical protein